MYRGQGLEGALGFLVEAVARDEGFARLFVNAVHLARQVQDGQQQQGQQGGQQQQQHGGGERQEQQQPKQEGE